MDIRDAVEADADRLAALTDAPTDVMRNLVHDRTVRVAEDEGEVRGFVSYDAAGTTVHVTQLEGDADLCERLLSEPVRFADGESMAAELLITEGDADGRTAAERAGFESVGAGPSFDGTDTTRFRWTPTE